VGRRQSVRVALATFRYSRVSTTIIHHEFLPPDLTVYSQRRLTVNLAVITMASARQCGPIVMMPSTAWTEPLMPADGLE